jgi:hypothetical protein
MDMNMIVAAIYAASADQSRIRSAASFLLRYDEMLATLRAREEARNISMAEALQSEP